LEFLVVNLNNVCGVQEGALLANIRLDFSVTNQGILKGKYHCAVDLLFDWFGISCMLTDNFYLFAKQANPNQLNRRSMVQR
jgi:hypothetical protein